MHALAGDDLVGVYAGGSYALGAYEQGRSDLDAAAVVTEAPHPLREALVDALRHESLPCPARGLEFVLYTAESAQTPSIDAAFALNLNTGASMQFRADFEPDPGEAHWFPIDRSILAQHGLSLLGPPAAQVFAPIPRRLLLPLLAKSLRQQAAAGGRGDDVVLNACRTWMYVETGRWGSKPAAGAWAAPREPLADAALHARTGDATIAEEDARQFAARVIGLAETAR